MLHVHRAERADTLVAALADVLREPLADPFAPEIVAVPERGVERWLAQRLSHRLGAGAGRGDGVCARVLFPAPAAVVAEAVGGCCGIDPEDDPWHPARAVWPLLELIDEAAGEARFGVLGAYLGSGGNGAHRRGRRYAVARRLAGLFATYAAHRPGMLAAWQGGADLDGPDGDPLPDDLCWQPELWRRLRERIGVAGPAERIEAACTVLRTDPGLLDLPPRLSLFGPTRLAADQLAVLEALAVHREVHLWLPHPSPALWDAVAPHTGTVAARAADPTAELPRHPLLSSLGRDVRELQLRLPAGAAERRHRGPEPAGTLLGLLHRGLRDDALPEPDRRPRIDPADRSVAVHVCHGPDRQVEVLREVVLGLLAADPTLQPRDVLVMCPDVEIFAPLISASFGLVSAEGHPGHRLAVRLADRALGQVNPLLGTMASLLELADARVTASQLLDLAASAPVRRRFRITDDELDRLRDLVARSGVRWGLDGAHRRPFRLEGFGQNTWSAGLDRMLLGVAMAEDEQCWLGTALPLDDIDSSDVDLVGRLAELVDRLGAVLAGLNGERPLTAWSAALGDGLDALTVTTPADAWQSAQARAELAGMVRAAGPHAGTVPLTLADVRGLLADQLRGRPTRANFRTGTLTVATLVPMRSVPHRVVCLLGLDDGEFPRTGAADGDDVLARDPRVGERDPRSEDRQLLLDAIGAATEHLVVLYSGADARTNAPRPPAVPLGELLDTLDATACAASGGAVRQQVVVRHPLQPFDSRNFTPAALGVPGPFSFDAAALAGARAAAGGRSEPAPFLAAPLAPPPAPEAVELEDLARFLEHPARAFLRQRVGIALTIEDDEPADALPVDLDGLGRWSVGTRLLRDRLAGHPLQRCRQAEWRRGELPPGALGHRLLDTVAADVERLVTVAARLRPVEPEARDITAVLDGVPVVGTVGAVFGPAIVRVEYSRLAPKHRLRAWVQLLALTVAHPSTPWRAVTLGRGQYAGLARSVLGPVAPGTARAVLADLVALHRQGLCEPLPMATAACAAYARTRAGGGSPAAAEAGAEQAWAQGYGAERDDVAHQRIWGPDAPAAVLFATRADGPGEPTRFGRLAMRMWTPLLAAEEVDHP
ncbi:exodeoxyribonuclease V subunit gamma [Pseudonocardia asaccharolytica]|uniref:RecBCD enzyme subunit RecC n=1 Tax=Pseudonocardia asaccharolytica DSM 44247 = NBRC 16224 TaxID=1123024 RepID=A0A511CYK5_9PSEU|nr:exodeoxyribonuclease V subunit gamma [Pseudonocardia asaccharolytica]GEL17557.1 RecBCD enzyme subunit RecC [Pseudonocardia asaccharolytica DSM 44247 = NBRC 16224]